MLGLRSGQSLNVANTAVGKLRNAEYHFCMRTYHNMTRGESSIDWRNVKDIVNQGTAALREFLIGASYCTIALGHGRGRPMLTSSTSSTCLGTMTMNFLLIFQVSGTLLGICIHGARYFDSVIAGGIYSTYRTSESSLQGFHRDGGEIHHLRDGHLPVHVWPSGV